MVETQFGCVRVVLSTSVFEWMSASVHGELIFLSAAMKYLFNMFQTWLYGIFISSSVIFSSGSFIISRKPRPGLVWARPPWPLLLSWGLSAGFHSWLQCSESSHFSIVAPLFLGFVYYSSSSNQKFRGSFPCFLFYEWGVIFSRTWG